LIITTPTFQSSSEFKKDSKNSLTLWA